MPTRAEIVEAGAQVLHDSKCGDHPVSECARTVARQAETLTEAALSAMLPLIKAQMVAEVRDGSQIIHTPEGVPFRMNEPAALIIEEYEL